ncbi:hypothetical protein [Nonomuraea dietziae]|uniref:hypothetical protein n=1 Tax=Nonomuraea dietziae TaxID=65515 RepID=UPI0033EBAC59
MQEHELPTWNEIVRRAKDELSTAHDGLSDAQDWLTSSWRPLGTPLSAEAGQAAARAKQAAKEKAAAAAAAKASPAPPASEAGARADGRSADEIPASTASPCPVCGAAIGQARTGRPARYCGTPCRQAAHRGRRRITETAKRAAGLRDRLTAEVTSARQLAAELAQALEAIPAAGGVDGRGQADDVEPPTGWENELGELARRLTTLASSVSAHGRDHQAVVADWRHAARMAEIRSAPTSAEPSDESPTSPETNPSTPGAAAQVTR